uniref:Endochitinase Ziz m 1.0101 n=1 Tax=Ziziphus mauritiana TaxID=157914 RepID=CHIT_ZIZMA|nr:RecName: Full=Endochitinase Ziz m 1.0101; AltName: Full=Allergen Ziz m 1; AltName: Allergen=Ziz m 1.0101; Flags: Precursor [Ziziphus mauritiana]AAX40948.1 allergen Ziz m 1 [Ziziphus mauritiana]
MVPQAKLVVASLILTSALIQTSEAVGGIATYWGQYTETEEGSLAEACASNLYSYINIAYLNIFGEGRYLSLNISGHCSDCTFLGEEIKACQSQGVKIFLSLGGPYGDYHLTTDGDADRVAEQLWSSFLGGSKSTGVYQPLLGDVELDGIDLDIQIGPPEEYDVLARNLKDLTKDRTRPFYLSAAPKCSAYNDSDAYLWTAVETGLFDFVWVKFYNDTSCQYNNDTAAGLDAFYRSWYDWTVSLAEGNKLLIGIPASNETDNSPLGGYIPSDVLNDQIVSVIMTSSKFGGVNVWNRYYDLKTNYSSSIILEYVNSGTKYLPLRTKFMYQNA